jgi:hypothetical protein
MLADGSLTRLAFATASGFQSAGFLIVFLCFARLALTLQDLCKAAMGLDAPGIDSYGGS